MYVCVCRAVTEQQVRAAIDRGATTVDAVCRQCCAGDDCGACHETIEDLIEERWGAAESCVHLPVLESNGRAA